MKTAITELIEFDKNRETQRAELINRVISDFRTALSETAKIVEQVAPDIRAKILSDSEVIEILRGLGAKNGRAKVRVKSDDTKKTRATVTDEEILKFCAVEKSAEEIKSLGISNVTQRLKDVVGSNKIIIRKEGKKLFYKTV